MPSTTLQPNDRRIAQRHTLHHPAKVRLDGRARCQLAEVVNLSATGALLRMAGPVSVAMGDALALGLPDTLAPVVRQAAMPAASVVRAQQRGNHTDIAIVFKEPQKQLVGRCCAIQNMRNRQQAA